MPVTLDLSEDELRLVLEMAERGLEDLDYAIDQDNYGEEGTDERREIEEHMERCAAALHKVNTPRQSGTG
jgi:hypothetical protein